MKPLALNQQVTLGEYTLYNFESATPEMAQRFILGMGLQLTTTEDIMKVSSLFPPTSNDYQYLYATEPIEDRVNHELARWFRRNKTISVPVTFFLALGRGRGQTFIVHDMPYASLNADCWYAGKKKTQF